MTNIPMQKLQESLGLYSQRKVRVSRAEPTLKEMYDSELRLAFVSGTLYLYTKVDNALYRASFTKV